MKYQFSKTTMTSSLAAIACVGVLTACGGNKETEQKVQTVYQCINAPASITKVFDDALNENRIPIYVTEENAAQYSSSDWYKTHKAYFDEKNWSRENWKALQNLDECQSGLNLITADSGESKTTIRAQSFITFAKSTHEKYGDQQNYAANMELASIVDNNINCLYFKAYPQIVNSPNFDTLETLYPNILSVTWDDTTSTADGRDYLLRSIPAIEETGCLTDYRGLPKEWVSYALGIVGEGLISAQRLANHNQSIEQFKSTVIEYNEIVKEQHQELIDAGTTIPPKAKRDPLIIYRTNEGLLSSEDFSSQANMCENAKIKTFTSGAGKELFRMPQFCIELDSLCKSQTTPALPENQCARIQAKMNSVYK